MSVTPPLPAYRVVTCQSLFVWVSFFHLGGLRADLIPWQLESREKLGVARPFKRYCTTAAVNYDESNSRVHARMVWMVNIGSTCWWGCERMVQQSAWGAAATPVSSLENALSQEKIERLVRRLPGLQFPAILVHCKHFQSLNSAFINSFDCFPFHLLLFTFLLLIICGLLYCTSCFYLWTLWSISSLMTCLLTSALSYHKS